MMGDSKRILFYARDEPGVDTKVSADVVWLRPRPCSYSLENSLANSFRFVRCRGIGLQLPVDQQRELHERVDRHRRAVANEPDLDGRAFAQGELLAPPLPRRVGGRNAVDRRDEVDRKST